MIEFTITTPARKNPFTVSVEAQPDWKAGEYMAAASAAAKKLHGKSAHAVRTTGTPSGSGYFQPGRRYGGEDSSSVGQPFHISRND